MNLKKIDKLGFRHFKFRIKQDFQKLANYIDLKLETEMIFATINVNE